MKRPILILTVLPLIGSLIMIGCGKDDDDSEPKEVEVNADFDIIPKNPVTGEEVILDAGKTTVENNGDLEFNWSLDDPPGSEAQLISHTAENTALTPDIEGEYEITLEATANGESDVKTKSFTATIPNVLSSDITEEMTLTSDITYLVTDHIQVLAGLNIEAGTTIEFENGAGFEVSSSEGFITAVGTEEDPILLTGTDDQAGWWNGVFISESDNMQNELDYVTIEYGGGREFDGSGTGNVIVGELFNDDSEITINNSTFRQSGGEGIWIRDNGDLTEFTSNSFTDNDGPPVAIASSKAHQLDKASDYSGNEEDYIYVMSDHELEDENVNWLNLDVPYRIEEGIIDVKSVEIEIEEGSELQFEQNGRIQVSSHGGAIIAKGTNDDPILFTGSDDQPGWWDGIFIRESDNRNNELDNIIIEYAGGEEYTRSNKGNIVVGRHFSDDSRLTLTNSIVRHSGSNGLWVRTNGIINEDVCEVNTFENNAGEDCHIEE